MGNPTQANVSFGTGQWGRGTGMQRPVGAAANGPFAGSAMFAGDLGATGEGAPQERGGTSQYDGWGPGATTPGAAPTAPAPTPGVDPAWSRIFGAATPGEILQRRNNGQPIAEPPVAAAPGGGGGGQHGGWGPGATNVRSTPQAAGETVSAAPGLLNPLGDNGFSQAKQNGGQSNAQGAPTPPAPPQAPPAAPPTPPPAPTAAAWEAAVDTREASAPPPGEYVAPGQGQVATVGGQGQAVGTTPSLATTNAPMKSAPAAGNTVTWNGTTYQTTAPKPAAWAGWTGAQRNQWLSAHAAETAPPPPVSATVDPATGNVVPGGAPPTGQPPAGASPAGGTPATGDATPAGQPKSVLGTVKNHSLFYDLIGHRWEPGYGDDPNNPHHFDETVSAAGNWSYQPGTDPAGGAYGQFNDAGFWNKTGKFVTWDTKGLNWQDFAGPGYDPAAFMAAAPDKALTGKGFFQYGLGMTQAQVEQQNPLPDPGTFQSPHTFSGLNVPQDIFDTNSPNWIPNAGVRDVLAKSYSLANELSQAWAEPADTRDLKRIKDLSDKLELSRLALSMYGVNYDPKPGDAETGTPPGEYPNDKYNTDPYAPSTDHVSTSTGQIDRLFGGKSLEERTTNLEAKQGIEGANIGLADRAKAAALMKQRLDLARNDPSRAKSESMAMDIANNPDPTDWDTVRNKYVTDQDKGANEIVQNLSKGAARRGLDAGAVQGLQTQALGEQANRTASGLGDISIAQSKSKRAGELQALDALGTVYGRYTGTEMEALQALGNVIGGQYNTPTNPTANFANARLGLTAANESGQPTGPSPAQGALAGAATGASAGAALGPYGAIIGGLLGAGAGYYSAKKAQG